MTESDSDAYCAFCGLPLSDPVGARRPRHEIDYCCSGCRVAAAVDQAPVGDEAARRLLVRIGLAIFFTMNVLVFTMELWSQDVYADESYESEFAVHLRGLFQWASLLFAAPVLLLLGGPIAAGVRQSLRRRAVTTDLLILLGVVASYLYSATSVVRGAGQIYFEVGCVVLVFVSLGRWLESQGKHRTGSALDSLAKLLPDAVRRAAGRGPIASPHAEVELIARADICVGDLVRVLPGERVPVDGLVAAGRASLDEHIATGESRPVVKSVGDTVYSGALNFDGDLWIRVTAVAPEDLVSRLLQMVREARRLKGRHERLADRIAAWFTPIVCAIALTAGGWHGWFDGPDRGVLVGLAVVLIACPCAVGLATPMAVWTALGHAADRQVLFRSGAMLERLAEVRVVCFDKTGTLTSGAPEVRQIVTAHGVDRRTVLFVAKQLADGSLHHLSQAIVRYVNQSIPKPPADFDAPLRVDELKTQPGRGVAAINDECGVIALLGSARWMEELAQTVPADLTAALPIGDADEGPLALVAWGGVVRAAFIFSEQLRPEACNAVADCQALQLRTVLLTGDRRRRAASVARDLGVEVMAEQLPEEKAATLGRLGAKSAMVGDGLNDAPALAAAEVGVALGCGADLSREAAGVCLLADRLDRLPWAIALARQTVCIVRQNLFWAFAYNIAGIVLAATGRLNPIWAAAAMGLSSVMVIGNSLRLARFPETFRRTSSDVEQLAAPLANPPRFVRPIDTARTPSAAPSIDVANASPIEQLAGAS